MFVCRIMHSYIVSYIYYNTRTSLNSKTSKINTILWGIVHDQTYSLTAACYRGQEAPPPPSPATQPGWAALLCFPHDWVSGWHRYFRGHTAGAGIKLPMSAAL